MLSLPAAAAAQSAKASDNLILEEIVVTAQMREEKLKNVPASITALDGRQIQDQEIRDLTDVASQTPNFYGAKPGGRSHTTALNMRGVSSANGDFANPTVGVFVDGVKRGGGYDLDFFDVERVEVLRGPQGTLYGGNTLGGIVNIISQKPTFDWGGVGDVTFGTYRGLEERLAFGGPISDTVAFRLTGIKPNSDGYIQNLALGRPGETRNDVSGRAQLRWMPTPDWDINLNVSSFQYGGSFASFAPISILRHRPWSVTDNIPGRAQQNDFSQILNVNYKGDNFQFTSISGHRNWRSFESLDADYTPQQLATDRSTKRNDQFTQEIRLASPTGDTRFTWLIGAYYSNEAQRTSDDFFINPPLFGVVAPSRTLGVVNVSAENSAVFGQTTVGITEQLFATAGLRYDYVRKDMNSVAAFAMASDVFPGATKTGTREFDALLPKGALEYRWTPDLSTYVSISRGYKPGGFQTFNASNADVAYESQFLTSYEVGLKAAFLDNRLATRLAAFRIDSQGEQFATLVRPNVAVLQNIGRSHSQGFEAEARYLLMPRWELFGNAGIIEASIDALNQPTSDARVGARPGYVPRYNAVVGFQYNDPTGVYFTAENQSIGSYFLDFKQQVRQSPFNLLNAKLGYKHERYDIALFARNILDRAYLVSAFRGTLPGQGYVGRQGPPLTVGGTVRVTF